MTGPPVWPRERLWLWRIGFPIARAIATALVPMRVEGLEHLPTRGGYIVVADHISWYDPPAIEFALRVPIRYMAKREVFSVPIVGAVLRAIGNFPVRRGESDRGALEMALAVVAAGQPLGYFPEGTRSKDERLRQAKPGIAFLARRSGAPLVPVAISGSRGRLFSFPPRQRITVRVGEAVTAASLGASEGMDDQALADAIMLRVAALLPERMRGMYS
ncbi:MAG: 1-acyl-sn-glycerol-3-phosphate acyltransferase [Chloroflexi bacterium]|nr:1-acyl-sn-glycerol-3-phosphate acyltransferase [Chloroflexota bacterium]